MDKRRNQYFDLLSLGMIVFIAILSLIRFNYLPQYIDAWWHLSCANGYIESGGWVGWSWWDYAPWGRPQVYPPFYHFLLVFLKKAGLSSINAVRVTEVVILPLFFLVTWYVLRKILCAFSDSMFLYSYGSFLDFLYFSSFSSGVSFLSERTYKNNFGGSFRYPSFINPSAKIRFLSTVLFY